MESEPVSIIPNAKFSCPGLQLSPLEWFGFISAHGLKLMLNVVAHVGFPIREKAWARKFLAVSALGPVPGLVAGLVRNFGALSSGSRQDVGWVGIHLDEAQSENAHLLMWLEVRAGQPGVFVGPKMMRAIMTLAQVEPSLPSCLILLWGLSCLCNSQ